MNSNPRTNLHRGFQDTLYLPRHQGIFLVVSTPAPTVHGAPENPSAHALKPLLFIISFFFLPIFLFSFPPCPTPCILHGPWGEQVGMFFSVSAGNGLVMRKKRGAGGVAQWSLPCAISFGRVVLAVILFSLFAAPTVVHCLSRREKKEKKNLTPNNRLHQPLKVVFEMS